MSSPFGKATPESYFSGLRRKDSKNALATCHGVTSNGRACRRALSSPKNSSKFDGAVVITENDKDPALYFCWQHKDQAEAAKTEEGSIVELRGRHSLEEAFRSLGLEDVDEGDEGQRRGLMEPRETVAVDYGFPTVSSEFTPASRTPEKMYRHQNPRSHLRPAQQDSDSDSPIRHKPRRRRTTKNSQVRPKQSGWASIFTCCFTGEQSSRHNPEYDERHAPARLSPEMRQSARNSPLRSQQQPASRPPRQYQSTESVGNRFYKSPRHSPKSSVPSPPKIKRREVSKHRRSDSGIDSPSQSPLTPRRTSEGERRRYDRIDIPRQSRPSVQVYRDSAPEQRPYLQVPFSNSDSTQPLVKRRPLNPRSKSTPDPRQLNRTHGEWPPPLPRNANDSTRIAYAKLLTAMSEPPTKMDSPGYIYIFWQTDVEQTADETSAVASIISAPAERGLQRQETILQRRFFQTSANAKFSRIVENRTIFLKIGRATNVHQRLTQWKKQCDYAISLLRSYPYDPESYESARKVPYVGKVERLIHLHLEMMGQRVKKQCRCGTEHKEWFEVPANATAVREVDEVVRGWVKWSNERFVI